MRTTRTYLKRWGRPVAFYVDRDGIYKVNRHATVEEELQNREPLSQFSRAMEELGIEMIFAYSPQAKGRVERGFDTHQDRLVKELRLRGISSIEQANPYLWEEYIPEHNARYGVDPANPVEAHRPLLPDHDLAAILSFQIRRSVQRDFTIRHRNQFFQIERQSSVRVYPKTDVLVQERLDGSVHIVFKGHRLKFHQIPARPLHQPWLPKIKLKPLPIRLKPRHRVSPFYMAFTTRSSLPTNPPASALLQT